MTDEERQALNDEWVECQRRIWADGTSSTDYWRAVERSKEIDALLMHADYPDQHQTHEVHPST